MGAIKFEGLKGGSSHEHENIDVLRELNETEEQKLTYRGKELLTNDETTVILASQVIETHDRKFVNKTEKDSLRGVKGSIQSQLDMLKFLNASSMKFKGRYNTYADMIAGVTDPEEGYTVFIDSDETQNDFSTIYVFTTEWVRAKKDKKSASWEASNSEPVDTEVLWLDVSGRVPMIKWYNGTAWISVSGDMAKAIIVDSETSLNTTYSSHKINDDISKISIAVNNKQERLGYVPENIAKKGVANGYAPLNASGIIDDAFLNQKDINYVVPDEDGRLLIEDMEIGNICYQENTTEYFIFTSNNEWTRIGRGNNTLGKNNADSQRNPLVSDDINQGYGPGSIWINNATNKAYLCVINTTNSALWIMLGGKTVLNIGDIVTFRIDISTVIVGENQFMYEIPVCNSQTDFVELSINGLEQRDFEVVQLNDLSYLSLATELTISDIAFGEIYKQDLNKVETYMLKSQYDSLSDGKVDYARVSDNTDNISQWTNNKLYRIGNLISKDLSIHVCIEDHTSALSIDEAKWQLIKTDIKDLSKFTTDDLKESITRKYVTDIQKANIDKIPALEGLFPRVSTNESDISSLKAKDKATDIRIDKLKIQDLYNVSGLLKSSYLMVNEKGDKVYCNKTPLLPMKRVVDSANLTQNSIDTLHFENLKFKASSNGTYSYGLDATTFDIKDMPTEYVHGKVLVSDETNQKYVLANKEELTMSIENFKASLEEADYTLVDNKHEAIITHNMASEALLVSFVDANKQELKDITYQIIDKNSIKIISDTPRGTSIAINCALGAGNGYWQYLMDWSKIDFVDDTRLRNDRAYSSIKLTNEFCKKADTYSKLESDNRFAIKELEHDHSNKATIDNFKEIEEEIYYKDKRLFTQIKPLTTTIDKDVSSLDLEEVINLNSIMLTNRFQALISSELLIENTSDTELQLLIQDGRFNLINVVLVPGDVQKYITGISKDIKIKTKGAGVIKFTASAF